MFEKKIHTSHILQTFTRISKKIGRFSYSVIAIYNNNNIIFLQSIIHTADGVIDAGHNVLIGSTIKGKISSMSFDNTIKGKLFLTLKSSRNVKYVQIDSQSNLLLLSNIK